MAIQNRYEFMYYFACTDGNPNGNPDMGNLPRVDPETLKGYISDVATKRRIRNYVSIAHGSEPGMNLLIQEATFINRHIAEAKKLAGVEGAKDTKSIYAGRKQACELFYDVRTFGAVMSTGPNAGQVRGPVQITFGKSLDPISINDISITRVAATGGEKAKIETAEEYLALEQATPDDKKRSMGRKQFIPFGLYEVRGFISANLAAETGFDEHDLDILFEAILSMYEHDRSASKGEMEVVSPLIIFKHVGTDTDTTQRIQQAKLGCAPAHKLFNLIEVKKKPEVEYPRSYNDYTAIVYLDKIPAGVDIGFKEDAFSPIVWNSLPEEEEWFTC